MKTHGFHGLSEVKNSYLADGAVPAPPAPVRPAAKAPAPKAPAGRSSSSSSEGSEASGDVPLVAAARAGDRWRVSGWALDGLRVRCRGALLKGGVKAGLALEASVSWWIAGHGRSWPS